MVRTYPILGINNAGLISFDWGEPYASDDVRDIIRSKASEAIPDVLRLREAKMEEFSDAHTMDVNSYSTSYERYGDFLQIRMRRGGDRYATSINLSLARELRLEVGHAPDFDGSATFKVTESEADKCTISINWPKKADNPLFLQETSQAHSTTVTVAVSGYDYILYGVRIDECPRPAMDDKIIFAGIGAIYLPFGLGEGVYSGIMKEIGDGFSMEKKK